MHASIFGIENRGGQREGSGRHGVVLKNGYCEAESLGGSKAYQSSGVGAVNTEQGNGRAGFLGRGGIGAQTHEGRARRGELLGGTEAGAGDTSGHHRGIECEESLGVREVTRELRWGWMRERRSGAS